MNRIFDQRTTQLFLDLERLHAPLHQPPKGYFKELIQRMRVKVKQLKVDVDTAHLLAVKDLADERANQNLLGLP